MPAQFADSTKTEGTHIMMRDQESMKKHADAVLYDAIMKCDGCMPEQIIFTKSDFVTMVVYYMVEYDVIFPTLKGPKYHGVNIVLVEP